MLKFDYIDWDKLNIYYNLILEIHIKNISTIMVRSFTLVSRIIREMYICLQVVVSFISKKVNFLLKRLELKLAILKGSFRS